MHFIKYFVSILILFRNRFRSKRKLVKTIRSHNFIGFYSLVRRADQRLQDGISSVIFQASPKQKARCVRVAKALEVTLPEVLVASALDQATEFRSSLAEVK